MIYDLQAKAPQEFDDMTMIKYYSPQYQAWIMADLQEELQDIYGSSASKIVYTVDGIITASVPVDKLAMRSVSHKEHMKRLLSGIQATLKRLWINAHQWNASRLVSTLQQVLNRCSEQSSTVITYQFIQSLSALRKICILWNYNNAGNGIISMSWNVKKSHD